MEVRKINSTELRRALELFYIAFEFAEKEPKTNAELLEELTAKQGGEKWAAFSDSGDMMSCVTTIPFAANFDGHTVKMSGIGGVSTLAQYRGSGGIRGCFENFIPYLYEQGYEFSYLYPFSTGYYEKFGYAMCGETVRYSINLRSLKRLNGADGTVFLHEGNTCLEEIKQVYRAYTKDFNICCVRRDFDFAAFEDAAPVKAERYTYLYKGANGAPKGVISFKKTAENGKFYMDCSEFWFTDNEGLKGLLNLTAAFGAYYEDVRFSLPAHINITSFVAEWAIYSNNVRHFSLGMARVIDVKKVLMLAKYCGSGSLAIKISDLQIPENNHTFKLGFEDGAAVSVEVDDTCATDIELSVNDFSRLILGDRDVRELQYMENIRINCSSDALSKVFYRKPIFICDLF